MKLPQAPISGIFAFSRHSLGYFGEADSLRQACNGFIQKLFNMKSLSQKLREILDKK
jgi:hypothetical protein